MGPKEHVTRAMVTNNDGRDTNTPEQAPRGATKDSRFRSRVRQFAYVTLGVAAAVTAFGWLTGLGRAFRGLLLVLTTIAFLPFMVVAGILLFLVILTLAAAIAGGDGHVVDAGAAESIVHTSRRLFGGYYGLLFGRRHPVALGVGAGLVLGTLLVFGLLSILVVPREACTLERLVAAKRGIDRYYETRGQYPPSMDGKGLSLSVIVLDDPAWDASCGPSSEGPRLLDGFGRAVLYETSQSLPHLAAYRLISLGFDGRASSDDLCVSGATRARRALDRVAAQLETVRALEGLLPKSDKAPSKPSWQPWWTALRYVDCSH